MKKKDELSDLMRAAGELDHELERFTDLARQIEKEPLGNQKSLDRAVSLMKQVAEIDGRLGGAVASLVQAIGIARDKQQKEVEAVNARAKQLEERLAVFRDLHERYEGLGKVALQVNEALLALGGTKIAEKQRAQDVAAALPELIGSLGRATDAAKELVRHAEEKGFPDLGRSTETLRQQILAAQNKLNLLQKKLGQVT